MTFTDTGYDTAGRIYDVNETKRLNDLADKLNNEMESADKEEAKEKDLKRYIVIGVGSLIVLGLLIFATRKKAKK
jgi:hypothetical protein